jgi:hypothetical protein
MYKEADGIEAYVYEDKIEDADAGGSLMQHKTVCLRCRNNTFSGAVTHFGSSHSQSADKQHVAAGQSAMH